METQLLRLGNSQFALSAKPFDCSHFERKNRGSRHNGGSGDLAAKRRAEARDLRGKSLSRRARRIYAL